jgi:TetR/AcrR family transcriptional regulator, regulator of cefoperazone and chloramphenicol sensitivity
MQPQQARSRRRPGAGAAAPPADTPAARRRAAASGSSASAAPAPARANGRASPERPQQASGARRAPAKALPREPPGDSVTRKRVIEAAIQCILEQGLYRASSNAIAERAGLTWGVIQYYFGTREALMLAVLEEGARRLGENVRTADITGDTLIERVEQYLDILAAYYGTPDYLAFTQVLINLSHDPRTSEQALETIERINDAANPEVRRLQAKVFAGTGIRRSAVRSLLFHALRGLALSHLMLGTVPLDSKQQARQFPAQRRLLAEALSLLIEQEAKHGR